jgi:hypothetical protein
MAVLDQKPWIVSSASQMHGATLMGHVFVTSCGAEMDVACTQGHVMCYAPWAVTVQREATVSSVLSTQFK